jgi:hypothetical protein
MYELVATTIPCETEFESSGSAPMVLSNTTEERASSGFINLLWYSGANKQLKHSSSPIGFCRLSKTKLVEFKGSYSGELEVIIDSNLNTRGKFRFTPDEDYYNAIEKIQEITNVKYQVEVIDYDAVIEDLHFLKKITLMESAGKLSIAMDLIFDTIDLHLMNHQFRRVDDIIDGFVQSIKSFELYLSFCTITGRYRNKLNKRKILTECTKNVGRTFMSVKEIESTMTGL